MSTQTDILQIKLETTGDGKVKASLAGVEGGVVSLDKSTAGLDKTFTAARVGMAALAVGGIALATEIVGTAASFEKMNASLKTVTGSQEEAARAMDMIKSLASDTPFSVQELTESFIKLKALGLEPSKEALISYGNTASAMGKDLNQMIEAVADASTGEFERLKEFGIKARSEGDKVSFTFQGVTTSVKNNAEDIQQYLLDIGNTQFAGAMAEQMETLDGHFSNLGDSADRLAVAIGEAGLSDAVKTLTSGLSNMLNTMAEVIELQKEPTKDPYLEQRVSIRDYNEELVKWKATYEQYDKLLKQPLPDATRAVLEQQLQQADDAIKTLEGAISGSEGALRAATEKKDKKPKSETPAELSDYDKAMKSYAESVEKAQLQNDILLDKQSLLDELFIEGSINAEVYQKELEKLTDANKDLADTGEDAFKRLEAAIRGWGDAFTDTLTEMVISGKADFHELADSIIEDLVRIQIQKSITDPLVDSMSSFSIGSLFGFANGGIMSSSGPLPLQKYAAGGIADRPQLAMFGEGSMREAFVPLPDGRSIPVTMNGGGLGNLRIELINQGGREMEATGADMNFDFDGAVIRVILNDQKNGGAATAGYQRMFGLNRNLR